MKETTKRTVTIVTIIISLSPCLLLLHYPAKPTIASVTLWVSAVVGSFTTDLPADDTRPVIYISGGIGITSFVDRIMRESNTREHWLFAANRTKPLAVLYAPLKQRLGDRARS